MALDDCGPGILDGRTSRKLEGDLAGSRQLPLDREQADPDAHSIASRASRSRRVRFDRHAPIQPR
jgi:hypothetical protein